MDIKRISALTIGLPVVVIFAIMAVSIYADDHIPSTNLQATLTSTPSHGSVILTKSLQLRLSTLEVPVIDFVFSSDGKMIATLSGSPENRIQIWETVSGRNLYTLEKPVKWFPNHIQFTPDGKLLVGTGRNLAMDYSNLVMWDVNTGRLLTKGEAVKGDFSAVVVSPDGSSVIAAMSILNEQDYTSSGVIYEWNITSLNKHKITVVETEGSIVHLSISTDKAYLVYAVTGNKSPIQLDKMLTPSNMATWSHTLTNGYLKLWDYHLNEAKLIGQYSAPIRAMAMSPDNTFAATAYEDNSVAIWDIQSGQTRMKLSNTDALALALSHDGKILATGDISNGFIELWDVATGDLLISQKTHTASLSVPIRKIGFSPDGQFLVTGAEDSLVRFWKIDAD